MPSSAAIGMRSRSGVRSIRLYSICRVGPTRDQRQPRHTPVNGSRILALAHIP